MTPEPTATVAPTKTQAPDSPTPVSTPTMVTPTPTATPLTDGGGQEESPSIFEQIIQLIVSFFRNLFGG